VCISALLNSAPVISQTGDAFGSFAMKSGAICRVQSSQF
jgi:hypothetical protein